MILRMLSKTLHSLRSAFWISIILCGILTSSLFATTDNNADGYDDLWQAIYGITISSHPLTEDADGDGATNEAESEAGTNPNDPNDFLRLVETTVSDTEVNVQVETVDGKKYQLKSSPTPGGPTWLDAGMAATGNGSIVTLTAPVAGGDRNFYRVLVTDQDSDMDGASDWAEAITGTNPGDQNSTTNASGGVATDGDTLRSVLSISFTTTEGDAFETPASPATVRLSRSFGTMPLTIPFSTAGAEDLKKGSASAGDYNLSGASGTSVTIPANAATHDITIQPVTDSLKEVPEALRLFVEIYGSSLTAEVSIKDKPPLGENQRLFVAYLTAEQGVTTTASGVVTALVSGDNDNATVGISFSNLSSEQNTAYIRYGSNLEVLRIPNGQTSGLNWNIRAVQILVTDQATLNALESGAIYVSVSSADNPAGEIRGNFQAAAGSIVDPPAPADPPTYGDPEFPNLAVGGTSNNPDLDRDIVRFLMQASFGPTTESIQELRDIIAANGNNALAGYSAWITKQMSTAPSDAPSPSLKTLVEAADMEEFLLRGNKPITFSNDPQFSGNSSQFNTGSRNWDASSIHQNNHPFDNNRRREWWTLILNSRDQLRQRTAFALSEIVVISENDTTVNSYHYGTANYWDMLAANAFGPYRTILEKVTYSPMMGVYLSHLKNQKQSGSISPDENYAREIMQLFSIGLVQRHLDGSLKLDPATALPLPTYDQGDITEMARVMTGMSFGKRHTLTSAPTYPSNTNQWVGTLQNVPANSAFTQSNGHLYWQGSWINDMAMYQAKHDFNNYTTYAGLPLPNGVSSASKILFRGKPGQKVIPLRSATDANGNLDVTDALNALAGSPGAGSWDGHPTTPVFVSRLLIQRFTTSNPSTGYLHRVATVFQNTKGDLGEVVKAILLDYEARTIPSAGGGSSPADAISHGKAKEPILHFAAMLRALKCYTGIPLDNLTSMPVSFSSSQSPVTTAYPASELAKFPAGTKRFRFFDTALTQSPQRAPSVFNWFLPDYVVPGPLGAAGLVAPEYQVATESNVINVINSHYNVIFTSVDPIVFSATQLAAGIRYGRGVDNFLNLSTYRNAGGTQLDVPPYGLPYHASTNPGGRGYFLKAKFDPAFPLEVPESINDQLDNVIPDWDPIEALYTAAYNQSLADQSVTGTPTTPQANVAHDAAAEVMVDHFDLLLSAGYLKAKFGGSSSPSPRQSILNALASNYIGNRSYHTNHVNYRLHLTYRIRASAYLVATTPQALILR
jgi:uncharacterized protein (DUF1800 family)